MQTNFLLLIVILAFSCSSINHRTVSNFEKGKIDKSWSKSKLSPNSYLVQKEIVRSGKYSLKLTLKKGMHEQIGNDGKKTERVELKERRQNFAKIGETHKYSFSFYLPKDFPATNTRLVLGQWKQQGKNSPVLSQRLSKGKFQIILSNRFGKEVIFELNKSKSKKLLGRWIDVSYQLTFSKKGKVKFKFAEYQREIRKELLYLADQPYFYFKFGLYRDQVNEDMTIYFDDFVHEKI